jgi:hypothetical protein
MTLELTQAEADALLAMDKQKADSKKYEYPQLGGLVNIPLLSMDRREKFMLDLSRRKIELSRNKFQTRAKEVIILARLDLEDTPHRNPNGEEVPGPHLHLYREGYGTSWAYPLLEEFTDPTDCMRTLSEFLRYCHVMDIPNIEGGLFTC